MNRMSIRAAMVPAVLLSLALAACSNDAPVPASGAHHAEPARSHDAGIRATTIPAEQARAAGIRVAPAGAATIADVHELQGLLTPVAGHVAQAVARFPGPVRSLDVHVGDRVRAGEVVARVESNKSLSTYAVRAPIAGVVTARHATVGSMAGAGQALLEIADLSVLWVDLHLFGRNADHIQAGATIEVTRLSDGKTTQATVERVLPGLASASQSTVARALIDNRDGQWRPGAAVKARVVVERKAVDVAVPLAALQRMDGDEVVFVRHGDTYAARKVETGERDARHVQIVDGLAAGEQVVVAESYLIKADIGKEGATHEH